MKYKIELGTAHRFIDADDMIDACKKLDIPTSNMKGDRNTMYAGNYKVTLQQPQEDKK